MAGSVREMRETLDAAIDTLNALIKDENATAKELEAAKAEMKSAKGDASAAYTMQAYEEYLADENPMRAALVAREYPSIGVKENRDDDGNTTGFSINEEVSVLVNIAGLETYYRSKITGSKKGKTLAANPDWLRIVQKFNLLLCMREAKRLHLSPSEVAKTFSISDAAAKVELGKEPDSEEKVRQMMQSVINAILFIPAGEENEIKVDKYDAAFLLGGYTKKNRKALSLAAANNRQLLDLLTDILHKKLVQKGYELTYKHKKAQ